MEFECIIYEKNENIATVKLNRPQVLNAMNRQLWLDLQAALEDAEADDAVRVLIITGEGRAFSTEGFAASERSVVSQRARCRL